MSIVSRALSAGQTSQTILAWPVYAHHSRQGAMIPYQICITVRGPSGASGWLPMRQSSSSISGTGIHVHIRLASVVGQEWAWTNMGGETVCQYFINTITSSSTLVYLVTLVTYLSPLAMH